MMEYIRGDSIGTGAVRTHDEDAMSTKTSVVPPAEGPSSHERTEKITAEEFGDPGASATCNTGLAEMREIALRYSSGYDEIKYSGGVKGRATRRQRDTHVVAYNAKRGATNISTVRENLKAAGVWLSRGLLKVLGVRYTSEKDCAEQRKKIPYIRSETEKTKKARSLAQKKGHAMGLEPTSV
jgi:hypothetical protein